MVDSLFFANPINIINQHILIWDVSENMKAFVHCKFCDPCRPFMLSSYTKLILKTGNWLPKTNTTLSNKLLTVTAIIFSPFPQYFRSSISIRKYRELIKYFETIDLQNYHFLPYLSHSLAISSLMPKNVLIQFGCEYPSDDFSYKILKSNKCPDNKAVPYPPNLRLALYRTTKQNPAEFQNVGLVFNKEQLAFVACHFKRKIWLSRLKELVSPFDTTTWFIIISSILMLSLVIQIQMRKVRLNTRYQDILYALCCLLVEKDSQIFDWYLVKSKNITYFTTFAVPFVSLVLCNEYSGDNITRLTVEPTLYPFDNFDDLVRHNFSIVTFPQVLENYEYELLKRNAEWNKNFTEIRRHEMFPVVSNLWYAIMLYSGSWNTLQNLTLKLSSRTRLYLKHTKVYHENLLNRSKTLQTSAAWYMMFF